MSNRTTRRIDTAILAKILGMLGSEHDGQALVAARQAARLVHEAGVTWADLLPPPPQPRALAERVVKPDGTYWLPPVGANWRETARLLYPLAHNLGREDQQLLTAIAQRAPIGRWQTPETITPEIAERLTMIYRRIAGLPT
jgi:hypothetical protein